ncbi:LOW QUALITY PROTEIN: leukocyte receptor cluster member 1 [Microcaecilia unicolor]|uniref:LOW QUALITY PROTEIN: leukocyte receptor cluster member 1 n=1 Tax=Microcaecilia unicolor TaxID=1415580 RepID=A0A6P7XMK0_9AMPH|nr:LOW QUALITY PROTEIN: leukocyte receptor cluster member 1 [Microcaecilia unicolor]
MNILPKKSWHVRNKDNVARVRRDEALAAEQELERKRRVELAEQEARTDLLRKKARHLLQPGTRENETALVAFKPDSSHINFFQDVEEGHTSKSRNKEYEEEKRQEKERQEKALGLLTYLGQSAAEAQTSLPWYQEVPEHIRRKGSSTTTHTRDEKLKRKLDPLPEMEKYLQKKKGEKKLKKDKEKKGSETRGSSSTATASIEQLRRDRLRREAAERSGAAALLDRRSREQQTLAAEETDERRRRYNSQFHPQLARKPHIQ